MLSGSQVLLALLSGAAVGFSLGLIGGGGSILAVPLLIYVVGIRDPHLAIGTSALAVAVNAWLNLISHWRAGTVQWPAAASFAVAGVAGALIGSTVGKWVNGQRLLFLFAIAMICVALAMLRPLHQSAPRPAGSAMARSARLAGMGLLVGAAAGFFGIGGGFLIVPGLMFAGGMPILSAIGSSLLSVGSFGLTTAANYARSGLVDWEAALWLVVGGLAGGVLGARFAVRLAARRRLLTYVFAGVVIAMAIYILVRSARA